MSKIIKYGFDAKQAIKAGVDKSANAVKVTLGPTGKAVILDKGFGSPDDYRRRSYRCQRNRAGR